MNVELKVDPTDIERHVVDAIIATSFGKQLKEAIDQALKNLGNSYSYDSQLRKWVEQKMSQIVFEHVQTHYAAQIEEQIKAWLTSAKLKEVTDSVIGEVVRNLRPKSY